MVITSPEPTQVAKIAATFGTIRRWELDRA